MKQPKVKALNHPNIATIYAIEEVGDVLFIAMEDIERRELPAMIKTLAKGQSLRKGFFAFR